MLPEEITKFIGKPMGKSVFQVEKEPIRRFADSVEDGNPLYWDEEYAKKSKYGSIIAPPGMICAPWYAARPTPWGPRGAVSPGAARPDLAKASSTCSWETTWSISYLNSAASASKDSGISERQGILRTRPEVMQ